MVPTRVTVGGSDPPPHAQCLPLEWGFTRSLWANRQEAAAAALTKFDSLAFAVL